MASGLAVGARYACDHSFGFHREDSHCVCVNQSHYLRSLLFEKKTGGGTIIHGLEEGRIQTS
jgi:hypothetical protein